MEVYDIAVIGSGPAGVSAAINLKLRNKKFIWLSSRTVSKKVFAAELIKNYPGLPDVTGGELGWTLLNHCESMGISPRESLVTGVYEGEGGFTLLAGGDSFEAKSVILCLGTETVKPLVGEEKFVGRGVSYCATCDGFLYKGKRIAVLCTDRAYEHEVEYLAEIAEKCYLFPMYRGCGIASDKVEIVNAKPLALSGGLRLERVEYEGGSIEADGLFILRGEMSASSLVHGLELKDGAIAVNRDMSTNIAGVFAAGDCTGRPYQYAKSVGEGNVAAHSACAYLAKVK